MGHVHRSEPELRNAIAHRLRAQGLLVTMNVPCAVGIVDLVIGHQEAVCEIKHRLTRAAIHSAVGQVQLYRICLNPKARAMIIGYAEPEAMTLRPYVQNLGIEVIFWEDPPSDAMQSDSAEFHHAQTPTPTPPRRSLRWNIATLAVARQLSSVPDIGRAVGIPRQGLYNIVNDRATQVSINMLGRLALGLEAQIGDWFIWHDTPNGPLLLWNVAAQAEQRGIRLAILGFMAELHTSSTGPIWQGYARATTLSTLGRIAHALDSEEHPFSIGNLFIWG